MWCSQWEVCFWLRFLIMKLNLFWSGVSITRESSKLIFWVIQETKLMHKTYSAAMRSHWSLKKVEKYLNRASGNLCLEILIKESAILIIFLSITFCKRTNVPLNAIDLHNIENEIISPTIFGRVWMFFIKNKWE